jgi:hypothetical protein
MSEEVIKAGKSQNLGRFIEQILLDDSEKGRTRPALRFELTASAQECKLSVRFGMAQIREVTSFDDIN